MVGDVVDPVPGGVPADRVPAVLEVVAPLPRMLEVVTAVALTSMLEVVAPAAGVLEVVVPAAVEGVPAVGRPAELPLGAAAAMVVGRRVAGRPRPVQPVGRSASGRVAGRPVDDPVDSVDGRPAVGSMDGPGPVAGGPVAADDGVDAAVVDGPVPRAVVGEPLPAEVDVALEELPAAEPDPDPADPVQPEVQPALVAEPGMQAVDREAGPLRVGRAEAASATPRHRPRRRPRRRPPRRPGRPPLRAGSPPGSGAGCRSRCRPGRRRPG